MLAKRADFEFGPPAYPRRADSPPHVSPAANGIAAQTAAQDAGRS
jgi:hypothetical protein